MLPGCLAGWLEELSWYCSVYILRTCKEKWGVILSSVFPEPFPGPAQALSNFPQICSCFLNVHVFNFWFPEELKMRNEGGGRRRKGTGFLNPWKSLQPEGTSLFTGFCSSKLLCFVCACLWSHFLSGSKRSGRFSVCSAFFLLCGGEWHLPSS